MSRNKHFFLAIILICLVVSKGFSSVQAQESTPAEDLPTLAPSVSVTAVPTISNSEYKDQLNQEVEKVKETYRGQLEEYRQSERNFSIAKDQYLKLQTLTSVDEAVKASRDLILKRNQVLDTYFSLLKLRLLVAEGIPVETKNSLIEQIESIKSELSLEKQQAEKIANRDDIKRLAADYKPLAENIKEAAYHNLLVLNLAKLQTAYNQAWVLKDEITQLDNNKPEETNLTIKQKKQIAVEEINQSLVSVQLSLNKEWEKLKPTTLEKKVVYKSIYDNMYKDYSPVHTKLNQIANYLEELLNMQTFPSAEPTN